jgi:hypothetical protein
MQLVVSGNVASHAPATITPAQMVAIYQCNTTDWATIGGTTGTIAPKIPQAGSGTRSFFEAQLKSANAGVAVTLGACVLPVQEHDDTEIKGNADAVAPFSVGRAALLGTTVKLEAGFKADRALYNVVRGTSGANGVGADDASIQAVFGENGFLCSNDARDEIEAAGFKQLASTADGGACGTLVSSTSNFALNEQVISSTDGLRAVPHRRLGEADGVDHPVDRSRFRRVLRWRHLGRPGARVLGHRDLHRHRPHGRRAPVHREVHAGLVHRGRLAGRDQRVREVRLLGAAGVLLRAVLRQGRHDPDDHVTGVPEGATITFNVGSYTKTATVASHIAKITYSTLNPGTYAVKATYAGSSQVAGSTASKSLVVAKAAPVISESFPTATLVGKPGTGTVKVAISGSTLKPTGTVRIYRGTTLLKSVTLSSTTGSASITLPKLPMGTQKLLIKYYGSAKVNAGSKYFYITQK